MATKLSFRARALDPVKKLPVFRSEDEPDILKEAAINRGVFEMATGMEKEEEEETHIAQVIHAANPLVSSVVIPIPEVKEESEKGQQKKGKEKFVLPKQYIRTQLAYSGLEEEVPEYDMDTEDEAWLEAYNAGGAPGGKLEEATKPPSEDGAVIKEGRGGRSAAAKGKGRESAEKAAAAAKSSTVVPPLTKDKFEIIFGRIESMVAHDPHVKAADLSSVAGPDVEWYTAIFEHLKVRLKKLGRSMVTPVIKPDNPDGSSARDAYVAFRKRTDKMQTRKNQKNIESSYVNMLKLHRDMLRCRDIMDTVKQRELLKRNILEIEKQVIDARIQMKDWSGAIAKKCLPQPVIKLQIPLKPPVIAPLRQGEPDTAKRSKPKKRKVRDSDDANVISKGKKRVNDSPVEASDESYTSESSAVTEDEYDHDEPFRLRRRFNMFYHAPLTEQPARISAASQYVQAVNVAPTEGKGRHRPALRGFCRRRVGRGGRIFIDRCRRDYDFVDELTWVTTEQEEDTRLQQARLRTYYAQRRRRESVSSEGATGGPANSAGVCSVTGSAGAAIAAAPGGASAMMSHAEMLPGSRYGDSYPKSSSVEASGRERLPPAGSDFGSGGENVREGPIVRLVAASDVSGQPVSNWMPLSTASSVKQKIGPHVSFGGATAPTSAASAAPSSEQHP